MAKNLVIVESPAKAKTIEGYLGKDFTVKSSYGHVRDLSSKGISVDIENNFEPNYSISSDKKQVVQELKKLSKDAETVWLATDEDREGEAISWHLKEALGLKDNNVKRITFNEITKSAITKAIENPRQIDVNLVDAQQARRVLDRLVGYELSPVLWKKVKPSLSAGRVQSVAVRLIVEREKEIRDFTPESFYRIQALFNINGTEVKASLPTDLKTIEEAQSYLEKCLAGGFQIDSVEQKPGKKSPAQPFTTSTLQQEASLKLGFSVSRTMMVAQRLYESGRITYMRTDSVNLSDQALDQAKNEIIASYGAEFSNPKKYKTKSESAQEAHEAIRPTDFSLHRLTEDSDEARLYELIWKRTVASQMSDAKLQRTIFKIDNGKVDKPLQAKGEVITFEGFLKVYLESKHDFEDEESEDTILPDVKNGDPCDLLSGDALQKFSRPPYRFSEASLVKKLEELGIGRPSTYAPTISTIQKRGYVEKGILEGKERTLTNLIIEKDQIKKVERTEVYGADRNKLMPTDIGFVVNDFLVDHFKDIMNYDFTAQVEKEFDDIAKGMLQWTEMIKKFYTPFHTNVEDTLEHSDRATGERELGVDPKSGKPVMARIGRFGPMIQIGSQEDEEKPQFASLRAGQSISTITLEEALELFSFPRILGEHDGKEIKVNIGKYGPYVQYDGKFASIPAEEDPGSVSLTRAVEIMEEKLKEDANKIIKVFSEDDTMQLLNGKYGPYLKIGRKNFKLPKDVEPANLSYEECVEISKNQPKPKRKAKKK
ncbi:MAG: type I DNA topoisomerase [Crocinitomicaceae bacterium]